jgi:hypothetical protein
LLDTIVPHGGEIHRIVLTRKLPYQVLSMLDDVISGSRFAHRERT